MAQYPKTPTLSLYKKDSQKILDWGHAARLAMLKAAGARAQAKLDQKRIEMEAARK